MFAEKHKQANLLINRQKHVMEISLPQQQEQIPHNSNKIITFAHGNIDSINSIIGPKNMPPNCTKQIPSNNK
jgi:hypothetical protein